MQELARYWATEYDVRGCERRLSALPNFITEIDGLDIHFIHVRSEHETVYHLKDIPKAHADIEANRVAGNVLGVIARRAMPPYGGRASQPPGPHSMPLVRLNQKGALRND